MKAAHKELASGRWSEMPFSEQMANVGSEVERAISWRKKGNSDYSYKAFERALELLDLTIKDVKGRGKLKELMRLREIMADFFAFDNEYKSTDKSWSKYFYSFIYASRMNR